MPLALIRRAALAQEHFALAVRCVYCTPKNLSNNMILSHEGGIAIDFECAPDECFTRPPERGLIVHANHWQSPVALGRLREGRSRWCPTASIAISGADILERDLGALTLDHVKAALFDDLATPWSVCRPPRRNTASNLTATVAMVAMQPAEGVMEVAMLPALDRQFTVRARSAARRAGRRNRRAVRRRLILTLCAALPGLAPLLASGPAGAVSDTLRVAMNSDSANRSLRQP